MFENFTPLFERTPQHKPNREASLKAAKSKTGVTVHLRFPVAQTLEDEERNFKLLTNAENHQLLLVQSDKLEADAAIRTVTQRRASHAEIRLGVINTETMDWEGATDEVADNVRKAAVKNELIVQEGVTGHVITLTQSVFESLFK